MILITILTIKIKLYIYHFSWSLLFLAHRLPLSSGSSRPWRDETDDNTIDKGYSEVRRDTIAGICWKLMTVIPTTKASFRERGKVCMGWFSSRIKRSILTWMLHRIVSSFPVFKFFLMMSNALRYRTKYY